MDVHNVFMQIGIRDAHMKPLVHYISAPLLAGSMKANFLALLVAAVSFTAGGNCAECISRDDAIHAGVHMLSTSGGRGRECEMCMLIVINLCSFFLFFLKMRRKVAVP